MSRLFELIACALRWGNHVETVNMDMLALFGADQMLKLGGVEGHRHALLQRWEVTIGSVPEHFMQRSRGKIGRATQLLDD